MIAVSTRKTRYLTFKLSMPSCGSWNGRWTGEDRNYVLVRKFSGKKGNEKASKILEQGSYWYGWNDGWGANIEVKEVPGIEARKIKKKSDGFCGYDWMVDSIYLYGDIRLIKNSELCKN